MSVHQLKDGRWIVCYRNGQKKLWEYFGRGIDAEQQSIARNAELNLNEYHRKTDPRRQVTPTFLELISAYLKSRAIHFYAAKHSFITPVQADLHHLTKNRTMR